MSQSRGNPGKDGLAASKPAGQGHVGIADDLNVSCVAARSMGRSSHQLFDAKAAQKQHSFHCPEWPAGKRDVVKKRF